MKRIGIVVFVSLVWLTACSMPSLPSLPSIPFFNSLPDGVTLIEEQEIRGDDVGIPYKKYQLENGLTVILSPDHSDPLVHVDVTYHVGSAREEVGKSGFAHFFEHMMFQGSENVGDQQHFKLVTEAGGTLNGTTNRDRTNYFQTVPANQLEKMLWLEADRMGFLLDAVSKRKFEIQRDTVKNERAQNFENRPYGLLWERMGEAMYPEGHPYSWQPIGYVEDLDRVNVEDLKAFFLRWYGPNNAVLTIGGDIDVEETLEWIVKYFGSIPRGPEVEQALKQPAILTEDRFVTLEDNIRQPMVVIGWPTGYLGDDDQVSLNALASILGKGANSLLYQELVKTRKVLDAGAFHDCAELACSFYVYAMIGESQGSLDKVYQDLLAIVESIAEQGIESQRLQDIVGMSEANAVFALQSVRGKVSQLAANETFFEQPDRTQTRLEKIRSLTEAQVMEAYQTYILGKNTVTLSVVPENKTSLAAKPANFETPKRSIPDLTLATSEDAKYIKPVDKFDRSVMPEPQRGVSVSTPDIYRQHFANGMSLIGTISKETPTVQVLLQIPAGERFSPRGKEGLASLTAAMIEQGSEQLSLEQLESELARMGSSISFSAGSYVTNVSVSSLTKNLPQTLALLENALFQPAFKQDDFQRLQKQMLEGVVYQHQQPSWLASQATRQVLFGDSIFARSEDGTIESISNLTLDDVKDFYQRHYTPQGAQLVIVGDTKPSAAVEDLAFLVEWQGKPSALLTPQIVEPLQARSIYLVDKPNAPQSIVRLIRQGLPFDATREVYLKQLANFNLAGNFNSRINQNLREDKGYTYGASGYIAANREVGAVVFKAQVKQSATADTIRELEKELANFAEEGITENELKFLRLAVGQQEALTYETPSQKANLLSSILTYQLDEDYLQQRNDIVARVSEADINLIASKWFNPDDYQIVVVGDAQRIRSDLEKLEIPIVELEIVH